MHTLRLIAMTVSVLTAMLGGVFAGASGSLPVMIAVALVTFTAFGVYCWADNQILKQNRDNKSL